jgi:hypothetical protein
LISVRVSRKAYFQAPNKHSMKEKEVSQEEPTFFTISSRLPSTFMIEKIRKDIQSTLESVTYP